jgi:tetratricopeptide (TPR) repeat protein
MTPEISASGQRAERTLSEAAREIARRRPDQAIAVLEDELRLVRTSPGHQADYFWALLDELAYAHETDGDLATAAKVYERELGGKDRTALSAAERKSWNLLSGIYIRLGRYEEAISMIEYSLAREEPLGLRRLAYTMWHVQLAEIYEEIGQPAKALPHREWVLSYWLNICRDHKAYAEQHLSVKVLAENVASLREELSDGH